MTDFLQKQQKIAQAFGCAAQTYHQAAFIAHEVGDRVLARLDYVKMAPQVVLDLGCATGYCTAKLEERYPSAQVIGIDFAYTMTQFAHKNRPLSAQHQFICSNAYMLPFADQSVDLIFSNLMLHWCQEIPFLMHELQRIIKPNGLLMFTSFGPDTLYELRHSWRKIDNFAHVHNLLDMHDIGDSLLEAGFIDPVMDMEKITLVYPDLLHLIHELKAMGIKNQSTQRNPALTGKNTWQQLTQHYEIYRTEKGLLPATFEVIYGHAWGTDMHLANKKLASGEVLVPLSSIKKR